jgi:hypothetical protein
VPGGSVQTNDALAEWIGVEALLGQLLGRYRLVVGAAGKYNLRILQRNSTQGRPIFLNHRRRPSARDDKQTATRRRCSAEFMAAEISQNGIEVAETSLTSRSDLIVADDLGIGVEGAIV